MDDLTDIIGGKLDYHDHPATPIMFGGLVMWAADDPDCQKRFKEETGMDIKGPTDGMSLMVDKACGYDTEVAKAFTKWCAHELWGMEGAEMKGQNTNGDD